MMTRMQKKLVDIPLLPHKESKLDFPEVFSANGILLYPTSSSGTVAGLALLVPMSLTFGKPISFPVNYRPTDLAAIRKKSTTKVIGNEVKVSKLICIKDKLYNKALYDFVGITAGAQLYFAPGSIKRKERPTVDKSLLGDNCLPGLLQTWMSVDFQLPTVCKQHNLLVSNLEVKQPTITEINSLYFLLNINTFFPNVKIETLSSESQSKTLKYDFAPLHLVVKQLSKL